MPATVAQLPWMQGYERWLSLPSCVPQTCAAHYDPIVVVGIPRSGTSMMAKLLTNLGVCLGFRFGPADVWNPTGYYEDRDILELYDAVLYNLVNEQTLLTVMAYYIQLRRSMGVRWGWKVPRTVLHCRHYYELCPNMRIIWCIRDADDVKRSMQRVWEIGEAEVEEVHSMYEQAIQQNLPTNVEILQVPFAEMRANPLGVLQHVCAYCDLPSPAQPDDMVSFIRSSMATPVTEDTVDYSHTKVIV